MADQGILAKAQTRFTLKQVEQQQVEVVQVIGEAELQDLLTSEVAARTAHLQAEIDDLTAQLSELESEGGGLEAAAAEAALEAESAALEAKAAAELRAEQAESRAAQLEKELAQLKQAAVASFQREAEEEAEQLAAEGAAAKAEAEAERNAKLEAEERAKREAEEKAKREAEEAEKAKSALTDEEHHRASRLARTLMEDVVDEGEDKATSALAEGKFREVFASELDSAQNTYKRRVKKELQESRDHWEEALQELEAKHKSEG